jgi:BirA family biotin operon repressor/biotin-[acetyl-CoA-carboxylase] ligase
MTELRSDAILQALAQRQFKHAVHLHLFSSIDSTNQYLKNLAAPHAIEICCAEMQTAGRGRFGRTWYSPFGENVYCSSRWHFDCDLQRLSGLSLVVSLASFLCLQRWGIGEQLKIKWPNDLLWQDQKISGNLIEVVSETQTDVVIGIGINANSKLQSNSRPPSTWCSMRDILGTAIDRNCLIADLIIQLDDFLQIFILEGLEPFMPLWQQVDYLYGQTICVSEPQGQRIGLAQGISSAGQLIFLDEQGKTHFLSSADTSLHKENSSFF